MKAREITYKVTYETEKETKEVEITGSLFYYDGCHKIYVVEDKEDIETMEKIGGYQLHKMSELLDTYDNSCSLRFINNVKLTKVFVPQCVKVTGFQSIYASEEKELAVC